MWGENLKKQRGETFSVGSVVEAGPCVTQTLTLEENYQSFSCSIRHIFYVYLVIAHFVGAVVWQSGDARPDLGGEVQKVIGHPTPASKIFCLSFFQKQFQSTSSVGVPATLNILSSWSKTSLGKHRGEFVSFLKRSFSHSKIVDT